MTTKMDPDVPRLRQALAHLQMLVANGAAEPREANMALGKLADSLVEDRRAKTPVRYSTEGGKGSWLPTY